MEISKLWSSVEFMLGLALLIVGLGARLAMHADPRLLMLAPFGGGLIACEALCQLVKYTAGRISKRGYEKH